MTYSSDNRRTSPSLAELFARKEELARLQKGTAEYVEALAAYEDALDLAMFNRFEPLPEEFELSEEEMPPDYLEFKKSYQEEGPYTFEDFYPTVTIAAHVHVKRVGWRAETIRVRPVEVYKGALYEGQKIHVPNVWVINPREWYRKGDDAIVFARDDSRVYLSGLLGYLKLLETEEDNYAGSPFKYEPFWSSFRPKVVGEVCLISWPRLREYLLSH